MLVVMIFAARWVIGYLSIPSALFDRIIMGLIGLSLMLIAEFTLVLWARGMSVRGVFLQSEIVFPGRFITYCSGYLP